MGSKELAKLPGPLVSRRKDELEFNMALKVGVGFWFKCRKLQGTVTLTLTMSLSNTIINVFQPVREQKTQKI